MNYFEAVVLGVVQGLTEFLPVSSSGHLVLAQSLFGLTNPEEVLLFDMALHFGTLLAVLVVFFKDLRWMFKDCIASVVERSLDRSRHSGGWLTLMVGVATIPAVVVGLFFKEGVEALFVSPRVAAFGLLFTGLVLWITKYARFQDAKEPSLSSAFLVGVAQAVAIIPGVSRSGSTIATGLFCRFDRSMAARFAFLMAVPAILGATLLAGLDIEWSRSLVGPLLAGTLTSALTGFLAIKWLLRIIAGGRLYWFAPYCWVVGVVMLVTL